jgi:hypothetical protein
MNRTPSSKSLDSEVGSSGSATKVRSVKVTPDKRKREISSDADNEEEHPESFTSPLKLSLFPKMDTRPYKYDEEAIDINIANFGPAMKRLLKAKRKFERAIDKMAPIAGALGIRISWYNGVDCDPSQNQDSDDE